MVIRCFIAGLLAAGLICSSSAYAQRDRDAMEEEIKEQVKAEMSGGGSSRPSGGGGGIDKESLKAQARQQLGLPGGASGGDDSKQALKEQVKRELGIPKEPAQAKKPKAASFDEAMKNIVDPMALNLNKCKAGIVNTDSTFTSFGVSLWMLMVEFKLYKGSDGGPLNTSLDKDNNIFSIVVRDSGKVSSFKFSVDTDYQFARLTGAEIDKTKVGPQDALAVFSGLREKQSKTPFSQNDLNNAVLAAIRDIQEAQKPMMEKITAKLDPTKLAVAFAAVLLAIAAVAAVSRSGGKRPASSGKNDRKAPARQSPEERPREETPRERRERPRGEKEDEERMQREIEGTKRVYSAIDIYDQIEKLSQLKNKGVISGDDFEKKKKELLDRI